MMQNTNTNSRHIHTLAALALIAAVYAALTMSTGFMSYGSVQFRIAEALCILPFLFPGTTWGLVAGCLIANLISAYGIADIVFGTLATLLSCLAVSAIGRGHGTESWWRCAAACLMPVLFNAVIVGVVIAYASTPEAYSAPFWLLFAANALSVGFGELVVLFVLGLPLLRWLPNSRLYRQMAAQF